MEKQSKPGIFDILMRVKELSRIVLSRWYIIIASMLLVAYFMYYKAKQVPITYSASLVFMLADEEINQGGGGGAFNIASQLGLVNQNATGNKQLLKELMDSRTIIEYTLFMESTIDGKTDLLVNHYIDVLNPDTKNLVNNPMKFTKDFKTGKDARRDSYLASLSSSIASSYFSTIKESGIFVTSFSSPSEEFTKEFLDNQIKAISQYYTKKKTEKSQSILDYAQHRCDSLNQILSGTEYSLAKEMDMNGIVIRRVARVPEERQKRNMEIVSDMYGNAVKDLELAKMSVVRETPFIQVVEDIRYPLAKSSRKIVSKVSIGLAIGFFIPIGLIIGLFFANDFLKREKEKYALKMQSGSLPPKTAVKKPEQNQI